MGVLGFFNTRITPTESTEVIGSNMSSSTSINQPKRDVESQFSNNTNGENINTKWWRIGVDVPLFLALLVLVALFEVGIIPQHKGGFFCNDPALSFSFTGDTVSTAVLISTVLLLPLILVFVTELILFDSAYTSRTRLRYVSRRTLILYGKYMYGMLINLTITEVLKGITGSPRPTFFDICEPDTAKTCTGSEYVSTFKCTSVRFSSWFRSDSYHSFPSGHTSLSVLCGFFMAWYVQCRVFSWRRRSVLAAPLLQLLSLSYSAVCSLTRVTDHRHHWWDVLVGAVIGLLTTLYTVCVLCKNFKRPQPQILVSDPNRFLSEKLLVLVALFEVGIIPQHKGGFFCNDPALSFSFTGDTVSTAVLISTVLLLPLILVFVTELILFDSAYTSRTRLRYVSRRTLILYGKYMYGMLINLTITEVLKGITGSPRPTFFDICEPDTAKTCTGSEYVSTFKCTSVRFSSWFRSDSYHSFPSGHTSLSVLCGFFMAWYVQCRVFSWRRRSVLAAPLLQLLSLSYSAVCSLTRVTDHRHHWWDVLVGAVIGLLTTLYTVCVLCKNFKRPQPQILVSDPNRFLSEKRNRNRTLSLNLCCDRNRN